MSRPWPLGYISLMHEVVPSVVAIAVRMVMARWMIFCSNVLFMVFVRFVKE